MSCGPVEFFMWGTIIGVALLLFSIVVLAIAKDWAYRMHTRWFPMPRETWNVVIYAIFGLFKIAVLVLFFIPYLALVIMGCCR